MVAMIVVCQNYVPTGKSCPKNNIDSLTMAVWRFGVNSGKWMGLIFRRWDVN
jgi:hypothetical protein